MTAGMNSQVNGGISNANRYAIAFGFSLALACGVILLFGQGIFFALSYQPFVTTLLKVLLLFGALCAYILTFSAFRKVRLIMRMPALVALVALLQAASAFVIAYTGTLPLSLVAVADFVFGVCFGIFCLLWFAHATKLEFRLNLQNVIVVAGVVFIAIGLPAMLPEGIASFLLAVYIAVSCALFLTALHLTPLSETFLNVDKADSVTFPKLGHLTVLLYGLVFGYSLNALSSLLHDSWGQHPVAMLLFSIVVCVCAVIFISAACEKRDWLTYAFKNLFPLIAAALLLSLLIKMKVVEIIMLATAVGLLGAVVIANVVEISYITRLVGASSFFTFGKGRAPMIAGECLGFLLGAIGIYGGGPRLEIISLVSTIIVIVLIFFSMRLIPIADSNFESISTADQEVAEPVKTSLEEKCRICTERYGFSPRESEVFSLLARGRNPKYVQDALCISQHTVKTHCHHIYRKMGVNSHQELIDIVEALD